MKFFKKIQGGSKSKSKKSRIASPMAGSSALETLVPETSTKGEMTDADIVSRKAEFLELLAKEERAHRIKLAELRNEPVQGRRSTDPVIETETASPKTPQTQERIQLPPVSPSFEEVKSSLTAKDEAKSQGAQKAISKDDPSFSTPVARPTEAETRATIGKEIGGSAFLTSGNSGFKAPDFSLSLPDDAPREDVTPQSEPVAQSKEDSRSEVYSATVKPPFAEKDPYANMDFSRPIKGGRANVSELRLDVSRITSDLENGDALYRRAQQRVEGLMHFVESAEVDFSLLERIEPENRRLKARNAIITKELEDIVRKTALLETDLNEHRRRLAEVNVQYDTVNGNLAKAMKALSERDHDIRQLTNDISAITLKLDREKTTTEVEVRENNVLRDRVVNLTNSLEDTKASRAEAVKIIESLKIDLEDHRTARDRITDEAYDLRHALDDAHKQNNQMKGEMVALHQDISTFKTQYEFNIISRDDRITLLEAQIEDLARQIQHKDDILSSASRDVTDLRKSRTGGELERERLEKIIDAQTMQLEIAQKQILEGQSAIEEMDTRYRDVAAALSITQNRRAQQLPAQTPDIHPEMTDRVENRYLAPAEPQLPEASTLGNREQITDDYGTHDKNVIDDHIMDYKLGLRSSMIPEDLRAKLDEYGTKEEQSSNSQVEPTLQPREDNFDTLDQETIEDRIMDYKLGLRKNIF